MSADDLLDEGFGATRVMAILRGLGAARTLELAGRAWGAGVRMLEIPLQSDADAESLRAAAEAAAARGLVVGAGTVLTPDAVRHAHALGARYVVSPGFAEDVVATAHDLGMAALPGVATPTDVQAATRAGQRWLKVFPASVLTPEWISALRAPFPDTRFVATGGVTTGNAAAFLAAGARAVALGSALAHEPLDRLRALVES